MIDEKILAALRDSDTHVSGEDLCKLAGVSRAAIWKHVQNLRSEGYDIEALPHLGYRLVSVPDALLSAEIKWRLGTKIIGREVFSYGKTGSTNDVAYDLALRGIKDGAVVVAEEQTSGRGRHGRLWQSPSKGGIYMSCILRPELMPQEMPKITLIAAVAVAKAIVECFGLDASIKWPNDILVGDNKVCGILTEMRAEQDAVSFVIVGIGINVNTPLKSLPKGANSLTEELKRRGGISRMLSRLELCRLVIKNLDREYASLTKGAMAAIIEEWKKMSHMLGSRVRVSLPNRIIEGQSYDIDTDGGLLIRTETGLIEKVSSGDVIMVR